MTYIVQRNDRFYVVAYGGLDPLTRKEQRRWHPVGHDRDEAESVAARIDRDRAGAAPPRGGPVHLSEFLTDTWLPLKRRHVRATTAYRYSWFVDRYINPAIGDVPNAHLALPIRSADRPEPVQPVLACNSTPTQEERHTVRHTALATDPVAGLAVARSLQPRVSSCGPFTPTTAPDGSTNDTGSSPSNGATGRRGAGP